MSFDHVEYRLSYWRQRSAVRRAAWREVIRELIVGKGCESCGFQSERLGFFDLDHIDRDTKTTEIARLVRDLNPKREDHRERFMAELAKCRVLCVACHREHTAQQNTI